MKGNDFYANLLKFIGICFLFLFLMRFGVLNPNNAGYAIVGVIFLFWALPFIAKNGIPHFFLVIIEQIAVTVLMVLIAVTIYYFKNH